MTLWERPHCLFPPKFTPNITTADAGIFTKKSAHSIFKKRLVLAGDQSWIENRIIEKSNHVFITREELIRPFATEEVREFTKHHNAKYYGESLDVFDQPKTGTTRSNQQNS